MKYVFFYLMFTIFQNCTGQTKVQNNKLQYVSYTAATRGSSFTCKVSPVSILIDINGVKEQRDTIIMLQEDWKQISKLVGELDLEKIHSLKVPTDDRFTDRYRIAEVEINKGGKLYVSNTFDEGNTPKELKPLVDKLLMLSQTVE